MACLKNLGFASLLLSVCFGLTGCRATNHTGAGTAIGAGLGTIAGAIIGHQTGNTGAGALIGAAAGGLTGALAGNAADAHEERDRAILHAQYVEEQRQAEAQALNNYDLVRMTSSGVGDDVIIGAIKSRGGKFDVSPDGIVQLKTMGVSDQVIIAAQNSPSPVLTSSPTVMTKTKYVVAPEPDIIVVRPSPWCYHDPWHHHHYRTGFHWHFD